MDFAPAHGRGARADAALIKVRQGTKFTFDCPSDSFEIGVRLVAV
jgi:hypothetical protein